MRALAHAKDIQDEQYSPSSRPGREVSRIWKLELGMSSISSASFQLSCSSALGSRRFLIEVERLTFYNQVRVSEHVERQTDRCIPTFSKPAFHGGGDDDKKLSMT